MTEKYCYGCAVREGVDEDCYLIEHNDTGLCPCTACIIKAMCVDPCDDYLAFRVESIKREEV